MQGAAFFQGRGNSQDAEETIVIVKTVVFRTSLPNGGEKASPGGAMCGGIGLSTSDLVVVKVPRFWR